MKDYKKILKSIKLAKQFISGIINNMRLKKPRYLNTTQRCPVTHDRIVGGRG
jgi:hypothetical protein